MKTLFLLLLCASTAFGQLERAGIRTLGTPGLTRSGAVTSAPLLPFTDAFNGDSLGPRWTSAGTWAVAGGVASCTPTLGAELLTNGDLETWNSATDPDVWTEWCSAAPASVTRSTVVHGGTYAAASYTNGSTMAEIFRVGFSTVGAFYQGTAWAKASTSNAVVRFGGDASADNRNFTAATSWTQYMVTYRATSTETPMLYTSSNSDTIYFDDATFKRINKSSIVNTVESGVANVDVSLNVTGGRTTTTLTDVGLVISYADTSNFVLASIVSKNDNNMQVELAKCVAGTWTSVILNTITYVAGAPLRVTKTGNDYSLYYNGTQVGSTTAITDAAIVSNTKHGMFSTYNGNSLDNFSVRAYP